MAGIYIHVPYCKTRCIYCDFYTQTKLSSRTSYVSTVCKEIQLRKDYIKGEMVDTIYFGGGTPSLLSEDGLNSIISVIYNTFDVATDVEITLEANPDDLSADYITSLKKTGFTRLSIGIQSFDDQELKFLNRRHTAADAVAAIKKAQETGFDNISIDLMYGLPQQSMAIWKRNLKEALSLQVQHISSYHLIYEEGTKLFQLFSAGKVNQVEEDLSVNMFSVMIDSLADGEFDHYEISNFAKQGLYSKHNTSYWQGTKYLGIGAAAHSFDGKDRAFNVASISEYTKGIDKGIPNIELEVLDTYSQYNDFILTGLRTKWGIDLSSLQNRFGEMFLTYCLTNINKHIASGSVIKQEDKLILTRQGIFVSDGVMSDLMWV